MITFQKIFQLIWASGCAGAPREAPGKATNQSRDCTSGGMKMSPRHLRRKPKPEAL